MKGISSLVCLVALGVCFLLVEGNARLDVFHQLLQLEGGDQNAGVLPVDKLQVVINKVFENLECGDNHDDDDGEDSHSHDSHDTDEESNTMTSNNSSYGVHGSCVASACMNASHLVRAVDGDVTVGVTEDEFLNASLVLMYYVTKLDHVCHTRLDLSTLTLRDARSHMANLTFGGSDLRTLMDKLKEHLSHDDHDDESHDHDNHDDDHVDHVSSEDDHSHEDHDDHDDHEDHDDVDGHDDDDEEDHSYYRLVVKEKCLSSDAVLYYMGADHEEGPLSLDVTSLSSVITYLIYKGSEPSDVCRLLPTKDAFTKNIYSSFAGAGSLLTVEGLEQLMSTLRINPGAADSADDHSGHDHSRKRRSLDDLRIQMSHVLSRNTNKRRKRQAASLTSSECYTANQLTALYETRLGINRTQFQQLCPALVSQMLYADCSSPSTPAAKVTDAEKYGYGTLAITIICLCAIMGVVFIPCTTLRVYGVIMSLFLGLAVGTLFADAVLHLIPQAFGVHNHGGEEHAHVSEGYEVAVYVQYGLAIMAGLYFFYLLETLMNRLGGHSHSHGDDEKAELKEISNGNVKHPESNQDAPEPERRGIAPVVVMVIFGDAIHNFADGLAVGAAFATSTSTGVATSIAVFCHELPHELGDFAVLLQSGMTFKKAVCLNFLSALTAYAGLFVGIAVSSEHEATSRWIFAVAAGMFIYIALVDLLPQLVKTTGRLNTVLNNLGILLGFAIMLLIAIFEEHITL